MLGNGRPFMLECVNPTKLVTAKKNQEQLSKLIGEHSQVVSANNTKFVEKTYFEVLKNMETDKVKEYRCVVWTKKPLTAEDVKTLNTMNTIEVNQKTPIRVLHRRCLKTRIKYIYGLKYQKINDHFFVFIPVVNY